MRIPLTRISVLLATFPLILLAGSSPTPASCPTGGVHQGNGGGRFTGCGDTAYAFVWRHQWAVQRLVNGESYKYNPAGIDSGALATVADFVLSRGAVAGDYTSGPFYWGSPGADGCPRLQPDGDFSCMSPLVHSLPVVDFVISGRWDTNPDVALAAVVSVDGNEPYGGWILDNAGAPSIDGNPCGADATSFKSPPEIACGAVSPPRIDSVSCVANGCNVMVTLPPSQVPILDDCEVAQSKATTCMGPAGDRRYLSGWPGIFYKKAPCDSPPADTRTYIMNPDPDLPTATPNFIAYSFEDVNLNGTLDPGEDGLHGGNVNGRLDPSVLQQNNLEPDSLSDTLTLFFPATSPEPECVYLGTGLYLDARPVLGEPVVTPLVSMNPDPIVLTCDTSDRDGDGTSGCHGDCDDSDPAVHPGAAEVCNGRDDNCDGQIDEGEDDLCPSDNPCVLGWCDGASGCSTLPVYDGFPCDDGMSCTVNDVCHAGVCAGSAAPSISVSLSPAVLRPANHQMVAITATVTAMDACGRSLTPILTSITSSESEDLQGSAERKTGPDIQGASLGTPDTRFQLRAERNKDGPGRTYTVVYTATGNLGETVTASASVFVPREESRDLWMLKGVSARSPH